MEKTNNKKKRIKIAIIICVILIILLLLLIAILTPKDKNQQKTSNTITLEEKEEMVTNYVRTRSEKERMQVYLSEYLKFIEDGKYDLAYEKLYPEFKNNFFETEQEYISYVKSHYSTLMMIDYEDIQRQGNIYILSVKITDLDDIQTESENVFMVQENGLNDYYISFQVKFDV